MAGQRCPGFSFAQHNQHIQEIRPKSTVYRASGVFVREKCEEFFSILGPMKGICRQGKLDNGASQH
jgi:hypothetical protein